jgi:GT2 family glycosyltransferase
MTRTLIGVNTLTSIDSLVYGNHIQFFTKTVKAYPNEQFITFMPRRMSIDMMRNTAARIAIDNDCKYLMFIDDDVLVPIDAYSKLRENLDHDYCDVSAGVTIIRGYPYNIMAFRNPYDNEDKNTLPCYNDYSEHISDGLVRCKAVGFSCVLIKVALLKKLTVPYFITGPNHTEDVYFCLKANNELGEDVRIVMNPELITGHLGGSSIITVNNRHLHREMDELEQRELTHSLEELPIFKPKPVVPPDLFKDDSRTEKFLEFCDT